MRRRPYREDLMKHTLLLTIVLSACSIQHSDAQQAPDPASGQSGTPDTGSTGTTTPTDTPTPAPADEMPIEVGTDATAGSMPLQKNFPDTTNGIHAFLTFDYYLDATQAAAAAPHNDFVWGARDGNVAAWHKANPNAFVSAYLPFSRDPDDSHSLAWWKQNHPDWILYKCDQKTPASVIAGAANIPVDV